MALPPDLSRRVLLIAGALSMPVCTRTAERALAGETADTSDTSDTAADTGGEWTTSPAGEEECPHFGGTLHTATRCIPWAEEPPCPDGEDLRRELVGPDEPEVRPAPGPGLYADGECCYEVSYAVCAMGCGCQHGRPLRIAGRPRTGRIAAVTGWFDPRLPVPDVSGLRPAERARLAHFWASVGVHEHASIASFHRAAAELLSLGAPLELVEGAQRAALDETRHAKLAFTLASRIVGAPVGPGPLALPDLPLAPDPAALAARTVAEGCLDETHSAAAAVAMRAAATDPAARAVLDRIVRDELRHVELAWRTLRWAVHVGGPGARGAAVEAFVAGATGLAAERPTGGDEPALAAWGCVGDPGLLRAARGVHRDLVRPAAEALLAA